MARRPRFTIAQVADALTRAAGIRSVAAKALGCTPRTLWNYIDRHQRLQDLEVEIVERNLDMAESQVLKLASNGNLTAAIFYLKTKGKHRGYTERHQVVGKNDGPVQHHVSAPKPVTAADILVTGADGQDRPLTHYADA